MPPPPPPPGPPPPPVFNAANTDMAQVGKKDAEGRNLLLSSIRQGTKLRKAESNDRSTPLIDGKSTSANNRNGEISRINGTPAGLGGLFAGGMPKLKSTSGVTGTTSNQNVLLPPNKRPVGPGMGTMRSVSSAANPPSQKSSSNTPQVPLVPPGTVQRNFPSDRGPAPQPPPASNKPTGVMQLGSATLPRRAGPPLPSKPPIVSGQRTSGTGLRPVSGSGGGGNKPIPPTKTPATANVPPNRPPNLRRPSSLSEHDYRTGRINKPNVLANSPWSTESTTPVNGSSPVTTPVGTGPPPPPRNNTAPSNLNQMNLKQAAPLPPPNPTVAGIYNLRSAAPPPPQRTTTAAKIGSRPPAPPNRAPVAIGLSTHPPHPAVAPPPPPHRIAPSPVLPSVRQHQHGQGIQPPPPPTGAPPPPPVRNTSTRNSYHSASSGSGDDFESRFYHKFKSFHELPPPDPLTNCAKSYPSKHQMNHRRHPPPPPPGTAHVPLATTQAMGSQMVLFQFNERVQRSNSSKC